MIDDWFKIKFKQSDKTKENITESSNKCWHSKQQTTSTYHKTLYLNGEQNILQIIIHDLLNEN